MLEEGHASVQCCTISYLLRRQRFSILTVDAKAPAETTYPRVGGQICMGKARERQAYISAALHRTCFSYNTNSQPRARIHQFMSRAGDGTKPASVTPESADIPVSTCLAGLRSDGSAFATQRGIGRFGVCERRHFGGRSDVR